MKQYASVTKMIRIVKNISVLSSGGLCLTSLLMLYLRFISNFFGNFIYFFFFIYFFLPAHFREAESKQSVELSSRKLQSEMKSKEQHILKLGADLTELQLQLDSEKNARVLQVC